MTQNQDVNRLIIAAGAMKTVGVSIDVDGNEAIITGNGSGGGGGSVIEQITTSADLTTTATAGAALACDGSTIAQLTLTLGTATTAPALQIQGSDDGTNWYNLGIPMTGVVSSTVTIQLNNILPKNLRWKVSTAGVSIGAGYKIILRCK